MLNRRAELEEELFRRAQVSPAPHPHHFPSQSVLEGLLPGALLGTTGVGGTGGGAVPSLGEGGVLGRSGDSCSEILS